MFFAGGRGRGPENEAAYALLFSRSSSVNDMVSLGSFSIGARRWLLFGNKKLQHGFWEIISLLRSVTFLQTPSVNKRQLSNMGLIEFSSCGGGL
jgi:hypothetical protein